MSKRIVFTMAAADPNGVAADQTTAGAANLVLNGALATGGVATMDYARHVSLESSADLRAVEFTVTGTDRFGNAITEAITGPNATTTTGAKNFKTITQIAVDGAVGTNVEVGSADEAETAWYPLDSYVHDGSVQIELTTGAGLTYALQTTSDNVQAAGFQENDAGVTVDSTIYNKTASLRSVHMGQGRPGHATAARIAVTGHTALGFTVTYLQPRR